MNALTARFQGSRVAAGIALMAAATTLSILRADDESDTPPDRDQATAELAEGAETLNAQPTEYARPFLIRFEGMITPMRAQYLYRGLDRAQEAGADLVIVEFHSPGGYLNESLDMANRLKDIDWARTVAFVRANEQALSGAAIAALGCDEIVMGDNAVFGDAGAIYQAEGFAFRYAPEKLKTDLVRKVRDIATAKGRAPAFAEAMVDMDVEVFRVRDKDSDDTGYLTQAEIDSAENPEQWEKVQLVHESREAKFLEVNGLRAVELGIAQQNAQARGQLADRFEMSVAPIIIEPNAVDTTVYILNRPAITVLLFIIGFVALFFELSAPGISIGGLTAGLCFALFFWSRFLGGTAGWLEVILFAAGLVFLAVEFFVIPGFGFAGLGGILLLGVSIVLASQTFVLPESRQDWTSLRESLLVLIGAFLAFILGAYLVVKFTGRVPLVSQLALEPPSAKGADVEGLDKALPQTGGDALVQVGDWGVAESPLRPSGKAEFSGEFYDVLTEGGFIDTGKPIRVVKMQGNRIVVREVT